jgi:hypothetical protein
MVNMHIPALAGVLLLLAGCQTSDVPSSGPVPFDMGNSAVHIDGLERFHQNAEVVTRWCRNTRFETDRRAAAVSAIRAALDSHAAALPGGLQLEVRSLDTRVRCNMDGFGGLKSYCVADASLTIVANGKDRKGQDVRLQANHDVSERVEGTILCVHVMPAVSKSVDKSLELSLVDLQRSLSPQTGVPAP